MCLLGSRKTVWRFFSPEIFFPVLKIKRSWESSSFEDVGPFILRKITFLDPHLSFTRRICALCASANASVIGLLPSRSVSLLQELGWSVCVYHCAWRAFYFLYTSFTLEKEEKQQFCENNVFRDVFSLTHLLQGVFVCPIISCNTTYSPLHTHDQVCVC